MHKFLKKIVRAIAFIVGLVILIIVVRAFDARSMPSLKPWHTTTIGNELLVNGEFETIDAYLKEEDSYIRNLYAELAGVSTGKFNKYNPKSATYPFPNSDNLNASFVYDPGVQNTKGVILLLHGLSDSPFHMRDLGMFFKNEGYFVLGLRLPGHGTLPSGLLNITSEDWMKATEWGAAQLHKIAKERNNVPLYMGGFSTGGALILNYTYKSLYNNQLYKPEKLFLFSAAIGVSKLATFSAWHKSLSWINYFNKFSWLDILPEYDAAKYNSFTKNAGRQIYLLTEENKKLVENIKEANLQNELPPKIAFQSYVDATVLPEDLVEMYQEIGTSKDVLCMFDVNRNYDDFMESSIVEKHPKNIQFNQKSKPQLHMVLNTMEADSVVGANAACIYKLKESDFEVVYPNKHIAWPNAFFAMSHVAIPIAENNALYGKNSTLGKMAIHGEKNVLFVSPNDLMRIRYNPFFDFMKLEIQSFIQQ